MGGVMASPRTEFITNDWPSGETAYCCLFVLSAVRSPSLQLRIHSSRRVVFHSTALIIIGILLEGTALAAYYVRTYGGDEATALSIILGFSIAIAVAIALSSTSIRSRLRTFLNENFFNYKYDYRLEWQKFIQALSACEGDDIPLCVLRTLAEVLDSPGGGLWVFQAIEGVAEVVVSLGKVGPQL